jgi:hypothetical protein
LGQCSVWSFARHGRHFGADLMTHSSIIQYY